MGSAHGEVHWSELMTTDAEAAKKFYSEVCGWTFDDMPMPFGTYHVAMTKDGPAAGIMPMNDEMAEHTPVGWYTYIAVDDVDRAVEQVKSAGGTALNDPFDVPEVGRIAIVKDSAGATIGLITPSEQPPS